MQKFQFTEKEEEVIQIILNNRILSNEEVAENLYMSKKTLETHISKILKKIKEYFATDKKGKKAILDFIYSLEKIRENP